jgi:hypothetical protein
MLTVYVLKNGVDRYNTFFSFFLHEILIFVSFSCRIRQYFFCAIHVLFLPQTISHMRKCFTEYVHFVGHGILATFNISQKKSIMPLNQNFFLQYLYLLFTE